MSDHAAEFQVHIAAEPITVFALFVDRQAFAHWMGAQMALLSETELDRATELIGRIEDATTMASAHESLNAIATALEQDHPELHRDRRVSMKTPPYPATPSACISALSPPTRS